MFKEEQQMSVVLPPGDPERVSTNACTATDAAAMDNGHAIAGSIEASAVSEDWHAAAGRKGAQRLRQLIEQGLLYEKEHGLRRGRQRIRQLVEEGKLYEREHGLAPVIRRRVRRSRSEKQELLRTLLDTLARLAEPALRPQIARLSVALDSMVDPTELDDRPETGETRGA
jgi:hypothetical protein